MLAARALEGPVIFLLLLVFTVTTAVVLALKQPEAAAAIAVGIGAFLALLALAASGRASIRLSAVLLLLGLAALAGPATATIIPLNWIDSGETLPPGYKIRVTVHSEGCVSCGGLADAGFMVFDKKFGITQQGRTVYIFFEGHPHEIGKLPWLTKTMYDAVFELRMYCPGEAPPGEQPQQGRIWLEVSSPSHGYKHVYLIQDPGPGGEAPHVYWFAENNSVISGEVRVGTSVKVSDCGNNYVGDPVEPGSGAGGNEHDLLDKLMHDKLKLALAALVALLIAPLIISLVSSMVGLYKTVKG